jgi:hypothetical protein
MTKPATKASPPTKRVVHHVHHVRWDVSVSKIILALVAAYLAWKGVDTALITALKLWR